LAQSGDGRSQTEHEISQSIIPAIENDLNNQQMQVIVDTGNTDEAFVVPARDEYMARTLQEPDSAVHSSRNSPEPSQTDLQGHYVGPSSGVSFLIRAQKRLHQIVSLPSSSSIFTFGDSALPEIDSSFFVLPLKSVASALVARYFDFGAPTHRFLHRPTVEGWLEEFYENLGVLRQKEGEREKKALIFMVFAQAKEYMPAQNGKPDVDSRFVAIKPMKYILRIAVLDIFKLLNMNFKQKLAQFV
jgi:hypothetical protein